MVVTLLHRKRRAGLAIDTVLYITPLELTKQA